MSRRITIQAHLSLEELQARYREAKDAAERSHYQIIWLLASGKPTEEVAAITGYSRSWIYELVWGYNRLGSEALGDKRHQNPGAKPLLNDVQQAQLWQALQEPPPDGGLWTGAKVAAWISELIGRKVSPQRGWEYLRALEMRRRRPRPEHEDTDMVEHIQWKKNWRRP
jgi:transposase